MHRRHDDAIDAHDVRVTTPRATTGATIVAGPAALSKSELFEVRLGTRDLPSDAP